MPPEIPAVLFNYDLAMVGSDLTVIDPKIDEIIGCLVKGLPKSWAPKTAWKIGPLPGEPSTYTVTNTAAKNDFFSANQALQNLYLTKYIGDGLPCGPATPAAVDWLMTGTENHKLTDIVGARSGFSGEIQSSRRILTYQMLAIQMAMAGGRPEYMETAAAIMESDNPEKGSIFASSGSGSPLMIVNGPIADDIRLNNGFGLIGPDPKWPAGRLIARACWLVRQNIGNMLSGKGTIGVYGNLRPGWCWAENEAGLPTGKEILPPGAPGGKPWTSFAQDFYNRPLGTNCVTSGQVFSDGFSSLPVRGVYTDPVLKSIQDPIDQTSVALTMPPIRVAADSKGSPKLLLLPAAICRFYNNYGWDKEKLRKQYADNMYYYLKSVAEFQSVKDAYAAAGKDVTKEDMNKKWKLCTDPQNLKIIACGGDHLVGMIINVWASFGNQLIPKPTNWAQLLKDAERDLGPYPEFGDYHNDL